MITDEEHPEFLKAWKEVLRRLGECLGDGTRECNQYLLREMFDITKRHREECKLRGIDFPVLVALVVPRLGIVEFKRADLDAASIRISIINFVRFHPEASMREIVNAFKSAYSDLKPDDILQPADIGQQSNAARVQKEAPEREN
jgi:hypothetical protein